MTEYVEDINLNEAVEGMIKDLNYPEFKGIRDAQIKFQPVMCVKTDKDDELVETKGDAAVLKKVPAHIAPFVDFHYSLVYDNYAWKHDNGVGIKASLHKCLMTLRVELDDKEQFRIGTRKPDVIEFSTTIARFGTYSAGSLNFKEVIQKGAKVFVDKMSS